MHDKTILNVDNSRNTIVVQGTTDELARVMDMVSTFDIDVLRGRSFALFPLNNVAPEQVIEELETVFNTSSGKDESEFFRFLPIERMNAVLAITHQSSYLRDIENWIFRLDRANTESGGGVNVYKVQHMDAEELAGTLNEIFTGASTKDKSAKVAAGKKSAEVSNKNASFDSGNSQKTAKTSVKRKTGTSGSSKSGGSSGSGGAAGDNDINIVADIANNSIIIMATPQEYGKILPVIKQLDIMPLQVLIDATIAEVTLRDDLQYGISWYLKNGAGNDSIGSNKAGSAALGTAAAAVAAASTGGLSAVYSSGSIKALLNAQATLDNIHIISSPSLMVLNNQEATIKVGDSIPTQTSQLTTAVTAATDTQNGLAQNSQIEYKETGVLLEVTPRVNSNGMVIMQIHQNVSNVVPLANGATTLTPTISNKDIESSVTVKDGETIALGGLIKTNNDFNKSGIPFLHELPFIGSLFGATTRKEDRTELVVLITPRVVKTTQDSRVVTDEFKRKLSGIYYDPTKPKKKGDWWRARDW